LSWLVPILAGGGFLIGLGFVAVRVSRRSQERQDAPVSQPADEQLEARLNDELRNLD